MSRREGRLFTLALAGSFTLHGTFLLLIPGTLPARLPPRLETVVVELLAPRRGEPLLYAPSAPPGEDVAPGSETKPEGAPAPDPKRQASNRPGSPPKPGEATARLPVPKTDAGSEAGRELRFAKASTPAPEGAKRAAPSRRSDFKDARTSERPPDPVNGAGSEAVLSLDEDDPRYRPYLERLQRVIYGSWYVGNSLLVTGGPKQVRLRFTLTPGGSVQGNVDVLQSSGHTILDQRAVDAVRKAAIPSFPEPWTIERLTLTASFEYLQL